MWLESVAVIMPAPRPIWKGCSDGVCLPIKPSQSPQQCCSNISPSAKSSTEKYHLMPFLARKIGQRCHRWFCGCLWLVFGHSWQWEANELGVDPQKRLDLCPWRWTYGGTHDKNKEIRGERKSRNTNWNMMRCEQHETTRLNSLHKDSSPPLPHFWPFLSRLQPLLLHWDLAFLCCHGAWQESMYVWCVGL